ANTERCFAMALTEWRKGRIDRGFLRSRGCFDGSRRRWHLRGSRDFCRRRGKIPSASADLDARTLHAHRDRVEFAIELSTRVVAEEIVRSQIVDDPSQSAVEIVGVDDSD